MNDMSLIEAPVVNAIVGREPAWIVRSGISLLCIIFILLIVLSWFIQYPDSINTKVTLTTHQPPIQLVAKSRGRIMQFFVVNGEAVNKGAPLVLLESSVDYYSFVALSEQLEREDIYTISEIGIAGLGELQPLINQLTLHSKKLNLYTQSTLQDAQVNNTRQLTQDYENLLRRYENKINTMYKKIEMEKELLNNRRMLREQGLITSVEMTGLENSYLDKKMQLGELEVQQELYQIKIAELAHQLTEYKIQRADKIEQLRTQVYNSYLALKSQMAQWQQKYLLVAPESGVVSFSQYWSVNQQVNAADVVVSLVKESDVRFGKIAMGQQGVGKVKVGQAVQIVLDSYPAEEFGIIVGEVSNISLIPDKKGYMLEISLPEQFQSSYGINLPFVPNTTGKAKIIIQKKRLLTRFLNKIFYVFEQ